MRIAASVPNWSSRAGMWPDLLGLVKVKIVKMSKFVFLLNLST